MDLWLGRSIKSSLDPPPLSIFVIDSFETAPPQEYKTARKWNSTPSGELFVVLRLRGSSARSIQILWKFLVPILSNALTDKLSNTASKSPTDDILMENTWSNQPSQQLMIFAGLLIEILK